MDVALVCIVFIVQLFAMVEARAAYEYFDNFGRVMAYERTYDDVTILNIC